MTGSNNLDACRSKPRTVPEKNLIFYHYRRLRASTQGLTAFGVTCHDQEIFRTSISLETKHPMSNPAPQSAVVTPAPASSGTVKKLVIGTLCGLLLAFLGLEVVSLLAAQQTEQNRRAVGMAGGRCETERRVPAWLQSLAGENLHSFLDETVIVSITLAGNTIGDEQLGKIPHLPALRMLDLHDSQVTSAGLNSIAHLKSLQLINLSNTPVTDITPLSPLPKLEALQLNFSQVRREHLRGLSQLQHLKELGTGYIQVDDQGVRDIAKCTTLEKLSLAASDLGEHGLEPLQSLKQLRSLVLKDAKFNAADLAALEAACPDVKVLK